MIVLSIDYGIINYIKILYNHYGDINFIIILCIDYNLTLAFDLIILTSVCYVYNLSLIM